jgi:hypothetical protein
MAAHKPSVLLQEYACGALRNLTVNTANSVAISAAGGIEALATAMETHQARAILQQNAAAGWRGLGVCRSVMLRQWHF